MSPPPIIPAADIPAGLLSHRSCTTQDFPVTPPWHAGAGKSRIGSRAMRQCLPSPPRRTSPTRQLFWVAERSWRFRNVSPRGKEWNSAPTRHSAKMQLCHAGWGYPCKLGLCRPTYKPLFTYLVGQVRTPNNIIAGCSCGLTTCYLPSGHSSWRAIMLQSSSSATMGDLLSFGDINGVVRELGAFPELSLNGGLPLSR